jgi:hypothetical protein
MRRMLIAIFVSSLLLPSAAFAQRKPPPDLEPLTEPPPPPAMPGPEEPRVNIPVQKGDKVEEARDASGRVIAVKVTPPGGAPYYLVDVSGNGQWVRRDALDADFRVPMWVIRTFD